MNKQEIVATLLSEAESKGVVAAIYGAFGGNVRVRVPFGKNACLTSIDEISFSVRASNSMKRANIFTVGDAIEMVENEGLLKIRNLGKKTQNEIKTRLLVFGYDALSVRERAEFFADMIDNNPIVE